MKKWYEAIMSRYYMAWKWIALMFAALAVSTVCTLPYYEPEQPSELAGLKRFGYFHKRG